MQIEQTYLRDYPTSCRPQRMFLGYVGEISPAGLEWKQGGELDDRGGDKIGKSGVEAAYDGICGARPAPLRFASGPALAGRRARSRSDGNAPTGNGCSATIDIALQRAAERAI